MSTYNDSKLNEILAAINNLDYGSILITIHEGGDYPIGYYGEKEISSYKKSSH